MKEKLASVDGLRAIFFISIFLGHARLSTAGVWGVCGFTLLSGCLMTIRHWDDEALLDNKVFSKENIQRAFRHIKRLYPLHLIMLLIALLYSGLSLKGIVQFIIDAVLIQSWIPFEGVYFSLNGVSWYISSLLLCYIAFPSVLRMVRRTKSSPLMSMLLLYVTLLIILIICNELDVKGYLRKLPSIMCDFPRWVSYVNPIINLYIFGIGCFLGVALIKQIPAGGDDSKKIISCLEVILVPIILINELMYQQEFLAGSTPWIKYSVMFIPEAVIMCICAIVDVEIIAKKLLKNPILVSIGKYSGYAYLIHFLPLVILHRALQSNEGIIPLSIRLLTGLISFLISVFFSIIYDLLFQKISIFFHDRSRNEVKNI